MPSSLDNLIRTLITRNGPMSVEAYWNLCLYHPDYGYYTTRDPLGTAGDFTTAPEISQLFGEMVGIWVAEQWQALGAPPEFHLVECGPGRGTLMADILRIIKIVPHMMDAVTLHLVETSPALRARQKEVLGEFPVVWHDSLDTIPSNSPIILVANEFLDALPIRQYVYEDGQWFERMVGVRENGELCWGLQSCPLTRPPHVGHPLPVGEMDGVRGEKIFEQSPARENFIEMLCTRIRGQSGAALLIDYGYSESQFIDTLQSVKSHSYTSVLENCGEADITSHVDFAMLKKIVEENKLSSCLESQKSFLTRMGIAARAEQLMQKSSAIASGYHRLVDSDKMGALFKVMEIVYEHS